MSKKERWATRLGLVLAMAGNAVGLGNFLRFPAQAAANGGGAFLIPYIVSLVLFGLPLIWVEWAMGRHGGQHGHHSAPGIFQAHGRSGIWKYFGVIGLWSCLIIAAFYLYIESWCLTYAGVSLVNGFHQMSTDQVRAFFFSLTGERPNEIVAIGPWGMAVFFVCITINILILSQGLARGIELVAKIGMPLLILFAAALAVRGLMIDPATDDGAVTSPFEGLNFVWQPQFDSLSNPKVWLAAAGQIFFTLSIGMGSIHCYASYLRETDDVALTGATTAWTNEFCEVILGGTILIPIAVAYLGLADVQSSSGFGLGFFVFPTLFDKWGTLAPVAGFMWFGLLFFAAITSSLAMGQPLMAFLQQEFGMTRPKSALAFGAMVLALALPVALMHSNTFFDEFDYWAGTVMLVVFAFGEAILFAWVFGMDRAWAEINKGAELWVPSVFYFIIKFITPVFLLLILLADAFQPVGRVHEADPKTQQMIAKELGWTPYIKAMFGGPAAPEWEWAVDGMIGKILHRDVAARRAQVTASDKMDPAEKEATLRFLDSLQTWRNIDRLVMVSVFAFLCTLVAMAWRRRAREGSVLG